VPLGLFLLLSIHGCCGLGYTHVEAAELSRYVRQGRHAVHHHKIPWDSSHNYADVIVDGERRDICFSPDAWTEARAMAGETPADR
jgi:hypothetical protein